MEIGAEAVVETVRRIASGEAEGQPQDDAAASPAPKIFREDAEIDWSQSASGVHNHIRALSPYPGAWTTWDPGSGPETLKILRSRIASAEDGAPEASGETSSPPATGAGRGGATCRSTTPLASTLRPARFSTPAARSWSRADRAGSRFWRSSGRASAAWTWRISSTAPISPEARGSARRRRSGPRYRLRGMEPNTPPDFRPLAPGAPAPPSPEASAPAASGGIPDLDALSARVAEASAWVPGLLAEVGRVVVGQETMLERLLVGLLTGGHVLLEGVPGLAKTLAVSSLAKAVHADFQRIQFTPDLLPADLVGTLVYHQGDGSFQVKKGAGLRQLRPGRRGQPRARQGAKCAPGSDARAAGHDRRHDVSAAQPVSRPRDAEPHRAGGHLPASRGAGGPLYAQKRSSAIPRDRTS